MIINIRGTSGSGKSTAVRRIMEQAHRTDKFFTEGRKNPYYYLCTFYPGGESIVIPGHYETQCGGCDTIKTYDELFNIIKFAHRGAKANVIFEGLLVAHDKKRCTELWEWLGQDPELFKIIEITTPLETCLKSVEERRAARKNPPTKPFNPTNTIRRYKEVVRSCEQLAEKGISILRAPREEVPILALDLLGLHDQATKIVDKVI